MWKKVKDWFMSGYERVRARNSKGQYIKDDPKTKKNVFATRTQIEERGLTPVPESPETTASQKDYSALLKVMETGTDLQKKVARIIYGKPGRDPMSKTEFLSKVTTNLSKDALADPDEIQKLNRRLASFWDKISERMKAIEDRLDVLEKNAT